MMNDATPGRHPADAIRHVAQLILICTPETVAACREKWAAALCTATQELEDAAYQPASSPGLGPRARDALRRAVATALRAGQGGRPTAATSQMQIDYALNLIETAMILDRAEAEIARTRVAQ
jgi:hypothetical protein